MTKHEYTLTVRLGYRRFPAEGQSPFSVPTGRIASKPEVICREVILRSVTA